MGTLALFACRKWPGAAMSRRRRARELRAPVRAQAAAMAGSNPASVLPPCGEGGAERAGGGLSASLISSCQAPLRHASHDTSPATGGGKYAAERGEGKSLRRCPPTLHGRARARPPRLGGGSGGAAERLGHRLKAGDGECGGMAGTGFFVKFMEDCLIGEGAVDM